MAILHTCTAHPHSYLQYLELCSKAVRACLKPEIAANAAKRGDSTLKFSVWENGKQGELSRRTSHRPPHPPEPIQPVSAKTFKGDA